VNKAHQEEEGCRTANVYAEDARPCFIPLIFISYRTQMAMGLISWMLILITKALPCGLALAPLAPRGRMGVLEALRDRRLKGRQPMLPGRPERDPSSIASRGSRASGAGSGPAASSILALHTRVSGP
jgi:hypothetical protein